MFLKWIKLKRFSFILLILGQLFNLVYISLNKTYILLIAIFSKLIFFFSDFPILIILLCLACKLGTYFSLLTIIKYIRHGRNDRMVKILRFNPSIARSGKSDTVSLILPLSCGLICRFTICSGL